VSVIDSLKQYVSDKFDNGRTEALMYKSPYYKASQFEPYNPSDLIRRKGLEIYSRMLEDEQVRAVFSTKLSAITWSGFAVEPATQDPVDVEIAEFVKYSLTDGYDGDFTKAIKGILSALAFGFSVSEKLYGVCEDGDHKGKIVLKQIKTRPPHSFEIYHDAYGNLVKIRQNADIGYIDILKSEMDYVIVYTYDNTCTGFGNTYGQSDLRAAYRAW